MTAALAILWFVWLLVAVVLVRESHGFIGLTRMFPEGSRWWHTLYQHATLINFTVAIYFNPFTS